MVWQRVGLHRAASPRAGTFFGMYLSSRMIPVSYTCSIGFLPLLNYSMVRPYTFSLHLLSLGVKSIDGIILVLVHGDVGRVNWSEGH